MKQFICAASFLASALALAQNDLAPVQPAPGNAKTASFIVGADVSFLRDMEAKGVVFKDHGTVKEGLEILRDHGYNWVRLRIMNEPSPLPNT